MNYNIRNTDVSFDLNLLKMTKDLANNAEKSGSHSITDKEIELLLKEAQKNDDIISEEELKFIAGLKTEENVTRLRQSNFKPVNKSIHFTNVSESSLNLVRKLAIQLLDFSKSTSVEKKLKQDQDLRPFFNTLNDFTLSKSDRINLINSYRDKAGSKVDAFDIIKKEDFFTILTSGEPGLTPYLLDQAQKKPLKHILKDFSIFITKNQGASPQVIFDNLIEIAKKHKVEDPNRYALMAMATLVQGIHKVYPKSPEKDMLTYAYIRLNEKSNSIVMNHGVDAPRDSNKKSKDYVADNNMHFWSHAFITYEMMTRGYSEDQAKAFSAYVGAVKEVPYLSVGRDIQENAGNSSIKDIIINAYGAEFGITLFKNHKTIIPTKFEGPQVQDRSLETQNITTHYVDSY